MYLKIIMNKNSVNNYNMYRFKKNCGNLFLLNAFGKIYQI